MSKPWSPDEMSGLALCRSLGRRAYTLKLDIIFNPYLRDSEKWHAFNKGWLDAAQEVATVRGAMS
jgi:hypothetical protein